MTDHQLGVIAVAFAGIAAIQAIVWLWDRFSGKPKSDSVQSPKPLYPRWATWILNGIGVALIAILVARTWFVEPNTCIPIAQNVDFHGFLDKIERHAALESALAGSMTFQEDPDTLAKALDHTDNTVNRKQFMTAPLGDRAREILVSNLQDLDKDVTALGYTVTHQAIAEAEEFFAHNDKADRADGCAKYHQISAAFKSELKPCRS